MHALLRLLLAVAALLAAMPAVAGDPCPRLRLQATAADMPTRIAAIACAENHAWYRSFIDADGRAGGQAVYEAENDTLADGVQAWRKVAGYWNQDALFAALYHNGRRYEMPPPTETELLYTDLDMGDAHYAAYKQLVQDKLVIFDDNTVLDASQAGAIRDGCLVSNSTTTSSPYSAAHASTSEYHPGGSGAISTTL